MADIIDIPRPALHEQVAQRLRALLVEGDIAPGAKLNERELARALQVSRTPLREAIKHARRRRAGRPAAEPRRGGGAADEEDVRHTFEVLAGLEGLSGELAAAAHRRRASWPSCARCTTRCWPATRGATCRATTGSTRGSTPASTPPPRNPVLTQHLPPVNARVQSLRFRTNQDERKWDARGARARPDDRCAGARATRAALRALLAQHLRHKRDTVLELMRAGELHAAGAARNRTTPHATTAAQLAPARHRAAAERGLRRARAPAARATRGEVLFDAASRGRYATDASIYQIMPVGVLVPRDRATTSPPRSTSRASSGAGAAARRRHQPVRPDRPARRWSSTTASTCARVLGVDVDARTRRGRAGLVLDHLNAQLKPHGLWYPGRRLDQRAGHARRHGRQQLVRLALASPTATWCTTCWARAPGWPMARWPTSARSPALGARAARHRRASCASSRARHARRDRRALAEGAAPRRRLQPRHLPTRRASAPTPATAASTWRTCWSAPKARWPARAALTLQLSRSCRAHKVLGVVNFPTFRAAMDAAQHIVKLGADRGRAGRPHDDRAGARQPGVPADDRDGADRRSRRRSCWSSSRATTAAALLRSCAQLVELMGDLGLPGSVVEMPDEARAEGAVGGAQGRASTS